MPNYELKPNKPGITEIRLKGAITADDMERLRDDISKLINEARKHGACGILVDVGAVDTFSLDGVDGLLEILTEPDELIKDVRTRFALMGVPPFSQRFLREALPLEDIPHLKARFFHDVAQAEALAWLQSLIDSADDLPETRASVKAAAQEPDKSEAKEPKPKSAAEVQKADPKPEKPAQPAKPEKPQKEEKQEKEEAPKAIKPGLFGGLLGGRNEPPKDDQPAAKADKTAPQENDPKKEKV